MSWLPDEDRGFKGGWKSFTTFQKFSLGLLVYNLLAVAWGVYVRASRSGDGCGSHWPLCDGESTPLRGDIGRYVEVSHRISTSLIGAFAVVLLVMAFRSFPKGHMARKAAVGVGVMTLVEGLFGALLVKQGWVTDNDSVGRAWGMIFHVISTYFLVGFLATTFLASFGVPKLRWKGQSAVGWLLGGVGFGLSLLAAGGAINALGHQIYPSKDVLKTAAMANAHWMQKLQPLHPMIAIAVGLFVLLSAGLLQHLRPSKAVRIATQTMVLVYVSQLIVGVLNIFAKAPIPMQMLHLVVGDLNWIALVATTVCVLHPDVERVEDRPAPEGSGVDTLRGRELIGAYVALTKPRIISLLLFTTMAAMIIAKGGWPGGWLFFTVFVAGYMAAGAANTINMVIDRDIDFRMKRTASRPTVTQSISSTNALMFAFTLAGLSFVMLWAVATLLSALMALSGLVFYVVIYTMLLKRRTWHNIVIGGAAGAFPPLVGWAAVTNDLPTLALYLFGIIFVWTPVHFWALALLIKDDYAAAGVPMLPVVKGDKNTVMQIGWYTLVTVVISMLPFMLPAVGYIYVVSAAVLNALLVHYFFGLKRKIERPQASRLFHYSMLYLALLFLFLAVDRVVVMGVIA